MSFQLGVGGVTAGLSLSAYGVYQYAKGNKKLGLACVATGGLSVGAGATALYNLFTQATTKTDFLAERACQAVPFLLLTMV